MWHTNSIQHNAVDENVVAVSSKDKWMDEVFHELMLTSIHPLTMIDSKRDCCWFVVIVVIVVVVVAVVGVQGRIGVEYELEKDGCGFGVGAVWGV